MGRMRTMKPEFFKSRSLAKLPRDARTTFAGLWTEADDFGNGIADERLLKGAIWPLDDDIEPLHVSAFLRMLAASNHIRLYAVGDETYFHIINFTKHQSAAYRRGEPKFPGPDAGQDVDPDPAPERMQESAERTPKSAVTRNEERGTGKGNTLPDSGDADVLQLHVPAGPKYPDAFEAAWTAYGRKGAKKTSYAEWQRVAKRADLAQVVAAIPAYVRSTPDMKFRKDFERWLKGDCWESVVVSRASGYTAYQDPQDLSGYYEDL